MIKYKEVNYQKLKTPCQFLASYKYIMPYLINKKVLDIGCATGNYLETFSQQSYGIDISKPNIDVCKKKGLNVKYVDINKKLPFSNNTFDVVFCSHVLEHVDSPLNLLREMNRVLKSKGSVIIGLPVEFSLVRIFRSHYFKGHKGHIYAFSPDNMKRLFEYSGFQYKRLIIDIVWVKKLWLWWLLWLVQKLPLFLTFWWSNAYWIIGTKSEDTFNK